ncbi:hypothetical protein SAMN05421644_12833 [Allochromatium warmingii]|uniref:Uncharacterized protein n=1 Tax=Allochromatium warmingii TaxID=61595 RepID=A0A1H3GZI9_ALLWA|nr:hypothetical protein [Allochromatium warmingii]SDY08743.1 hypothetical protein SAMN05421644_12833 [Allochromatium warmingii]
MKKTFPCGHTGKGQYCHRCKQEQTRTEQICATQQNHKDWHKLFELDAIDLRPLNSKNLVEKARKIIADIHAGGSYTIYKGKRMNYDRHVISVPLNRDWRLIFQDTQDGIRCYQLLSHEQYNVKKPGSSQLHSHFNT